MGARGVGPPAVPTTWPAGQREEIEVGPVVGAERVRGGVRACGGGGEASHADGGSGGGRGRAGIEWDARTGSRPNASKPEHHVRAVLSAPFGFRTLRFARGKAFLHYFFFLKRVRYFTPPPPPPPQTHNVRYFATPQTHNVRYFTPPSSTQMCATFTPPHTRHIPFLEKGAGRGRELPN